MTDFLRPAFGAPEAPRSRKRSLRPRPRNPSAPTRMKLRRLTPSQKQREAPVISSMPSLNQPSAGAAAPRGARPKITRAGRHTKGKSGQQGRLELMALENSLKYDL